MFKSFISVKQTSVINNVEMSLNGTKVEELLNTFNNLKSRYFSVLTVMDYFHLIVAT